MREECLGAGADEGGVVDLGIALDEGDVGAQVDAEREIPTRPVGDDRAGGAVGVDDSDGRGVAVDFIREAAAELLALGGCDARGFT